MDRTSDEFHIAGGKTVSLSELRSRNPLRALVERQTTLKRSGRLLKGCCPFHGEKRPSFIVDEGRDGGHFHCFGCGAHGDSIGFVARQRGGTYAETVRELAEEAGLVESSGTSERDKAARAERLALQARDEAARLANRERAEAEDRARSIAWVRRRVLRTQPIAGTLAERYLTETRGIPLPPAGWPDALRYDPQEPGLVLVATDSAGEVQAAQWVHLTPEATKAPETADRPTKQTRGPIVGAAVRLAGRAHAPLQTAEGGETGASVWASTGCETWIALGSINNLPIPPVGREIVACLDDDKRHGEAARRARRTLGKWRRAGVQFVTVKPWPVRREDGSDFNDLVREGGTGAVEARIIGALDPRLSIWEAPADNFAHRVADLPYKEAEAVKRAMAREKSIPLVPAVRLHEDAPIPVAIARYRVRNMIEVAAREARKAEKGDAPALAIGLGAGGGKSQIAFEVAVDTIRAMRADWDERTIVIETPRTALHDEMAERIRAYVAQDATGRAVTVGVYRGADAINPATGEPMCRNPEPRRAAEARQLDPRTTVCPACPLREGCGKLAQYDARADIWLVAHNMPFLTKPAALGEIAWRITDENAVDKALRGAGDPQSDDGDKPLLLTLDTLKRPDRVGDNQGETETLHEMRGRMLAAFESLQDGRMTRTALVNAGLTVDMLEAKIRLEYGTTLEPDIHDGMSMDERITALRATDINMDLGRRVMLDRTALTLLRNAGREESGNTEIVTLQEAVGAVRAVRMKGLRTIKAGWNRPNTIIDATLQPELLKPTVPNLRIEKLAPLAAPHRHIVQCADRAFSGSMLDQDAPGISERERGRRRRNLARLHLTLATQIRCRPDGRILISAPKRIEARLCELGDFGERVSWAHHGAVTGRDEWGDVRHVIVIGRLLPPPAAMERQAEALTGKPVERIPDGQWYPRRDATYLMADGTRVATETDFHPDPVAEAFRWRACEGEIVQIIERARGVNRQSDAERVDVLLMTDVPIPLPVDKLILADALSPRVEDRMLAKGGAVFSNAEGAAAAYPTLWHSGNTVRVARHRDRERHGTDWQPPPGLVRIRYRRAINGAQHDVALIDPAVIPDPAAHLRALFGEDVRFDDDCALQTNQDDSTLGSVMDRLTEYPVWTPDWALPPADGGIATHAPPDG